jgi:hypothetical protein
MKSEKLLLRRILSATVLATGFGTVWLIVVAVLGSVILQRFFTGEPSIRETLAVRALVHLSSRLNEAGPSRDFAISISTPLLAARSPH